MSTSARSGVDIEASRPDGESGTLTLLSVNRSQEQTPEQPLLAGAESTAREIGDSRSDPVVQAADRATAWRRDRDQVTLAVLLAVTLSILGWRYHQLASPRLGGLVVEKASDGIGYRIDLNSATWVELSQLEGIGPVLAKRTVADRDQNGPFESVEDLQRVSGIGPRTLERNRRWLKVPTDGAR